MCELRDGGEDWGNISNDCEFSARQIIWDNKRKSIRSSNKIPNNDDFRMFVLFPQHLAFLYRKQNVLIKDADCDLPYQLGQNQIQPRLFKQFHLGGRPEGHCHCIGWHGTAVHHCVGWSAVGAWQECTQSLESQEGK